MYKSLYEQMLSLVLCKHLDIEWMDHLVCVSLTFTEMALFSKAVVPFHIFSGSV